MSVQSTHEQSCDYTEPLGYPHFLYDVNIEYSKGGNEHLSECNTHTFKLKYLPYMIQTHQFKHNSNDDYYSPSNSLSSSINNCDQSSPMPFNQTPSPSFSSPNHLNESQIEDNESHFHDPRHIDVTKETCAFLGNSDYVPNYYHKFGHRRVVLELISAKLSRSTNILTNQSRSSLVTLAEQKTTRHPNGSITPIMNRRTNTMTNDTHLSDSSSGVVQIINNTRSSTNPYSTSSGSTPSSKPFVNYTILIKTIPGLDKHPTVIERRFSDFLLLYQGFKSKEEYANIIDKHISFPKKVYMGNFSLNNITERSVEFMRMLNLCMTDRKLLWSIPFISFLLDKELKEAHRLSLFGDPEDVQANIETVYFIQQKLFLNAQHTVNNSPTYHSDSSISSDNQEICNSSSVISPPINGSIDNNTITNPTISTSENENQLNGAYSESNQSSEESNSSFVDIKMNLTPLNQRLLVTFCMLFLTYYQAENYEDLKSVVKNFTRLISSQEYVDSILNTSHYRTLRACLLFLMNIYKGNVITESLRLSLKRRLEDIDGAHADLNISLDIADQQDSNCSNSEFNSARNRRRNSNNSVTASTFSITKGDLTSLIRDRNLCSFQDLIK